MQLFLLLMGIFCCIGVYKSKTEHQGRGDRINRRERTCPECGVTYNGEDEIRHIENNSMCYHCLAIFDDELRDMRSERGSSREDTFQTLHNPSHDWEDRDDIDEDKDFYNEVEEESERNYGWEDDSDDSDDDFDDDWDD